MSDTRPVPIDLAELRRRIRIAEELRGIEHRTNTRRMAAAARLRPVVDQARHGAQQQHEAPAGGTAGASTTTTVEAV